MLTNTQNQLVYRIRCQLNKWGFPGDELPVDEWVFHKIRGPVFEVEYWQLILQCSSSSSVDYLTLWHSAMPFTRNDPFGVRVASCDFGKPDGPGREIILWPELMPPIWQAAHKQEEESTHLYS